MEFDNKLKKKKVSEITKFKTRCRDPPWDGDASPMSKGGPMMQTCRSINVHVVNTDIC